MRRLWRRFKLAFWAAVDEVSGKADLERELAEMTVDAIAARFKADAERKVAEQMLAQRVLRVQHTGKPPKVH